MADITYYLIRERRLGKVQGDGYYLYDNGQWIADERNVILDHLVGFNPNDDSFYGFGNAQIMDEMEEITEEQALAFMNQREL